MSVEEACLLLSHLQTELDEFGSFECETYTERFDIVQAISIILAYIDLNNQT